MTAVLFAHAAKPQYEIVRFCTPSTKLGHAGEELLTRDEFIGFAKVVMTKPRILSGFLTWIVPIMCEKREGIR